MILFLYLLLAHLIADFLLQPEALVRWKHEKWQGIGLHCLVHFGISLLLLSPYLPSMNVLIVLVLVAMAHFLIDWIKVYFENRLNRYIVPFIVDQTIHVTVLILAAYMLRGDLLMLQFQPFLWLYSNPSVVVGLCLLILVTFAYELAVFQVGRKENSKYAPHYRRMAARLVIWGVLYGLFLMFGVYKIVAFGS